MPKVYVQFEGDSFDDIRAQAILALGLGAIATPQEAAAKAEELKAEPVEPAEEKAAEATSTVEEKPAAKKRGAGRPKKDKGNGKQPEPEAEKVLDLDSVRAAFQPYIAEFGMPAAQLDGPILIERIFGNGVRRVNDIPKDAPQDKLARIIAAIEAAVFTNEFSRTAVKTEVGAV